PPKRYPSAEALADDLDRFLAGRPIQARPAGIWEQVLKWARRRPAAAALVLVTGLASVLLLGTLLVSNVWIGRERDRAEGNYRTAEEHRERAEAHFQLAREAVDEYTTKISQDPRLRAHDLQDLRKQLLQSAVTFYRRLAEQRGDDPKLQAERGRAFARLGLLTQQLGAPLEALSHFQQ